MYFLILTERVSCFGQSALTTDSGDYKQRGQSKQCAKAASGSCFIAVAMEIEVTFGDDE